MNLVRNEALICENCFTCFKIPIQFTIPNELLEDRDIKEKPIDIGLYLSMGLKCPVCNKSFKNNYFFNVDEYIGPTISILNKLNYNTEYSCQGHCYRVSNKGLYGCSTPYISFKYRKNKKHISKKLINIMIKNGWNIISESDGYTILNTYIKKEEIDYDHIIKSNNSINFRLDVDSALKEFDQLLSKMKTKAEKIEMVNKIFAHKSFKLCKELYKAFKNCKCLENIYLEKDENNSEEGFNKYNLVYCAYK